MRRTVSLALAVCFIVPSAALAVDGKEAQYVGGTVSALKEKTEGPFSTQSETHFVFTSKKKDGGKLEVPYSSITALEYGQKAGRRVAVAVLVYYRWPILYCWIYCRDGVGDSGYDRVSA